MKRSLLAFFAASVLAWCPVDLAVAGDEATVLLVPAKYSVVAFCADVAKVKPVTMIAYDTSKKTTTPLLSLWDKTSEDWTRITFDDYRMGTVFSAMPKRVILVGNDAAMTDALKSASLAFGDVVVLTALDTMGLANGLNDALKFSASQWKYLAKRHDLKLQDLNWERRRYGKYGKPGEKPGTSLPPLTESERPVAPAKDSGKVKMPEVLDAPAVEPLPAKKAEKPRPEDK